MGSKSAKVLAKELCVKRVYPDRKYKKKEGDIVINWGNTKNPKWDTDNMLNKTTSVRIAVDKLECFTKLYNEGVSVVPFTKDKEEAKNWETVVVRHILNGSQGDGIEICGGNNLPEAPLYTKYIEKDREYRIHVFNGEVIDYVLKKRKNDTPESKIHNHKNGYVFSRSCDFERNDIKELAVRAIKSLGLDFGAVDIIRKGKDVYVLEINTACGLAGTTISSYVNAIKEYANI